MNETETLAETASGESPPIFRKKIRETTYVVKIHFSETAKETFEDKIKRMLKNEVERNVNSF